MIQKLVAVLTTVKKKYNILYLNYFFVGYVFNKPIFNKYSFINPYDIYAENFMSFHTDFIIFISFIITFLVFFLLKVFFAFKTGFIGLNSLIVEEHWALCPLLYNRTLFLSFSDSQKFLGITELYVIFFISNNLGWYGLFFWQFIPFLTSIVLNYLIDFYIWLLFFWHFKIKIPFYYKFIIKGFLWKVRWFFWFSWGRDFQTLKYSNKYVWVAWFITMYFWLQLWFLTIPLIAIVSIVFCIKRDFISKIIKKSSQLLRNFYEAFVLYSILNPMSTFFVFIIVVLFDFQPFLQIFFEFLTSFLNFLNFIDKTLDKINADSIQQFYEIFYYAFLEKLTNGSRFYFFFSSLIESAISVFLCFFFFVYQFFFKLIFNYIMLYVQYSLKGFVFFCILSIIVIIEVMFLPKNNFNNQLRRRLFFRHIKKSKFSTLKHVYKLKNRRLSYSKGKLKALADGFKMSFIKRNYGIKRVEKEYRVKLWEHYKPENKYTLEMGDLKENELSVFYWEWILQKKKVLKMRLQIKNNKKSNLKIINKNLNFIETIFVANRYRICTKLIPAKELIFYKKPLFFQNQRTGLKSLFCSNQW